VRLARTERIKGFLLLFFKKDVLPTASFSGLIFPSPAAIGASMPDDKFEAEDFPEELYLAAFGDVREAVRAGAFSSGYEHYVGFGRAEIAAGIRPSPFEPGPPGLERSILPAADVDEPVPPSPPPMSLPSYDGAISYTPQPPLAPRTEPDPFNETLYLALNPDVAEAVARGEFPDGHSHWLFARASPRIRSTRECRPPVPTPPSMPAISTPKAISCSTPMCARRWAAARRRHCTIGCTMAGSREG
jgi:hypothetical protein